jgi:HEAT repeats
MRPVRPLALAALALTASVHAAPPNVTVYVRPYYSYPPYSRFYPSPYDGIPVGAPPPKMFHVGGGPLPTYPGIVLTAPWTAGSPPPGLTAQQGLPYGVPVGNVGIPALPAAGGAAVQVPQVNPPFNPGLPAFNPALPAVPQFGAQGMAAPAWNAAVPVPPAVVPQPPAAGVDQALQLINSPRDRDRIDGALALGRARVEKGIEPLRKMLADDPNPRVREAAARALGLVATPECAKALEKAARADDDGEVRRTARLAAQVIRANTR